MFENGRQVKNRHVCWIIRFTDHTLASCFLAHLKTAMEKLRVKKPFYGGSYTIA